MRCNANARIHERSYSRIAVDSRVDADNYKISPADHAEIRRGGESSPRYRCPQHRTLFAGAYAFVVGIDA